MSAEHGQASPDPDDFDRQLRDLTSGVAEAPRFFEPSAAERARRAAKRAQARQPGQASRMNWRNARRARKLRRPVTGLESAGQSARPRGGRGQGGRPVPRSPRRRRLLSTAKAIGILVGFVALLFVLHLLGFGPH